MICLAPRAPGDSVRPRRLAGASVRPLNFTVRARRERQHFVGKLARLLLTVVIFAAVWGIYSRHRVHTTAVPSFARDPQGKDTSSPTDASEPMQLPFHCDGRTYCSQMTSCEEAKYFLAHCPNVKMDGDHNGIPCERQWCPGG